MPTSGAASWPTAGRLIIGIGGGSGSGKTTIAHSIVNAIGAGSVALIQQDAYYRDQTDLPLEERAKVNYDHPDSMESELLVEHLESLLAGRAVDRPVYDFTVHNRSTETVRVEPRPVVIVEGILVLSEPALRALPVPIVVVPHHPDDRQEQEQAGRREDDVQEVDVIGVPDTFFLSHDQILKKNSPIATTYFRLKSQRHSILIGSDIIIRNRNTPT